MNEMKFVGMVSKTKSFASNLQNCLQRLPLCMYSRLSFLQKDCVLALVLF